MEGSAAAAAATRALAEARGTMLKEKVFPPEKDLTDEPARVGVFVCNCGLNIGGVADVPAIVAYAQGIADVAYAQANLFTCSQDAQAQMVEMIKEHDLNRVVVAACSPSTHAPIFQDMLRTAGLNKYLFEMANIRNQCTWVHQNEPERATEKCKDLVNMAVAKARLLQPLEYLTVGVDHRALVIGGGVSGCTSALALADQGYEVHLVERKDRLGGNALKLHTTWRGGLVKPRLDALLRKVTGHDQIKIHYNAIVEEVHGVVGNFTSKLSTGAGDRPRGGGHRHRRRTLPPGRRVPLQAEPQRPALPGSGPGDHGEERAAQDRPGRSLHSVRGFPHPGTAVLQQGVLRPFGGERHQAEGDEPGPGRLRPLPGHADLRRTGTPVPSGPGNGGHVHPFQYRRTAGGGGSGRPPPNHGDGPVSWKGR